jgi:seryl-tRNA synthetase
MTSVCFPEEIGRLAREVIASYEARISWVERIVEATHEMLETFRRQREAMRAQLRETLARVASLRRRDFDAMMEGILVRQEERERAIKETIKDYLAEQRALAAALKEALARGEAERIGTVKELLKGIEARREEREREVRTLLADFQSEQDELVRALHGLLSNGSSVRVVEFKATLSAIQSRRWSKNDLASPAQLRREEGANVS